MASERIWALFSNDYRRLRLVFWTGRSASGPATSTTRFGDFVAASVLLTVFQVDFSAVFFLRVLIGSTRVWVSVAATAICGGRVGGGGSVVVVIVHELLLSSGSKAVQSTLVIFGVSEVKRRSRGHRVSHGHIPGPPTMRHVFFSKKSLLFKNQNRRKNRKLVKKRYTRLALLAFSLFLSSPLLYLESDIWLQTPNFESFDAPTSCLLLPLIQIDWEITQPGIWMEDNSNVLLFLVLCLFPVVDWDLTKNPNSSR